MHIITGLLTLFAICKCVCLFYSSTVKSRKFEVLVTGVFYFELSVVKLYEGRHKLVINAKMRGSLGRA